jgi:hypothetical protein
VHIALRSQLHPSQSDDSDSHGCHGTSSLKIWKGCRHTPHPTAYLAAQLQGSGDGCRIRLTGSLSAHHDASDASAQAQGPGHGPNLNGLETPRAAVTTMIMTRIPAAELM